MADLARREARREPVAAARRAAEAVVADEKWRAAQEKRERAARSEAGLRTNAASLHLQGGRGNEERSDEQEGCERKETNGC